MNTALAQARKSLREGGLPVGAALVDPEGVVVGAGRSLLVQTGDPTAHAGIVCLRNAGRRRDWHTLTLATTLSPGAMCAGAVAHYRIPRIVIGENETDAGRADWLRENGIDVAVLNDPRCVELMRRCIDQHPELWDEAIGAPPPPAPAATRVAA